VTGIILSDFKLSTGVGMGSTETVVLALEVDSFGCIGGFLKVLA